MLNCCYPGKRKKEGEWNYEKAQFEKMVGPRTDAVHAAERRGGAGRGRDRRPDDGYPGRPRGGDPCGGSGGARGAR